MRHVLVHDYYAKEESHQRGFSGFGKKHGLPRIEAYRYLKRFKGMEMLDKFYYVMHTFSFKDTTDDLTAFCHRQGEGACMKLYHGLTVDITKIALAKSKTNKDFGRRFYDTIDIFFYSKDS